MTDLHKYPFRVKVMRCDKYVLKHSSIALGAVYPARIQKWINGRKCPKVEVVAYIQNCTAPYGETLMYLRELKFLSFERTT